MRVAPCDDRGGIVIGWLTRITVLLALLGLFGYDAISVVVARTTAADHAVTAAAAGADAWVATHHDLRAVGVAVARSAQATGDTVDPDSPTVDADGTVHARLCRVATTLLLQRTARTREMASQCGSGQARTAG